MNIKDFLIDNYIWILVIILITIITIIGFLADKKKNGKKNEQTPAPNSNAITVQPVNNTTSQMQYQQPQMAPMPNQMNNNMNVGMNENNVNNQMQPMPKPINNSVDMSNNQNLTNANNINLIPQEQSIGITVPTSVNMMTSPNPVENITPSVNPEPIYQPLSEQKKVIPTQPLPNFTNIQNNQGMMPQPMENVMNSNVNNNIQPLPNSNIEIPINKPVQPIPNQNIQNQPMVNQIPNYNIPTPQMSQPIENNNFNIPNYNQNTMTIPEPVMSVPTPQPVQPQHIMQGQGTYNNQPMMQNSYSAQQNQMAKPMNHPVQQPIPNQNQQASSTPISFVFGPQNNNQNM